MTAPAFIYTSEPWAALSFGRPIFAPAFTRERMSAGHLPQSSSSSRFTADASGFFIFPWATLDKAAFKGPAELVSLLFSYTKRRRRLSSITRAPCRKVTGVPGQRSQAARKVASAT
jgi:hypothetical protein